LFERASDLRGFFRKSRNVIGVTAPKNRNENNPFVIARGLVRIVWKDEERMEAFLKVTAKPIREPINRT
jgi:hypothetical protein